MVRNRWRKVGAILVLAMTGSACTGGGQGEVIYPASQQAFYSLNKQCHQSYTRGQNEIQKSLAFNQCNKDRQTFSTDQKISGWVGEIIDISTDQGADVVSVTINATIDGFEVSFGTVTNRVSDYVTDSMITPTHPLFKVLASMQEGEVVRFDADFLQHPESGRGVWESSLTEQGSIDQPEFFLRFTNIEPYSALGSLADTHAPASSVASSQDLSNSEAMREEPGTGAAQELEPEMTEDAGDLSSSQMLKIGRLDEKGRYLLHREALDGSYFTEWYGKPSGDQRILIEAQGKSIFNATMIVDCARGGWLQWDGIEAGESADEVPAFVIKSASNMACVILNDDVEADVNDVKGKMLAEGKAILRMKGYIPESVSSNDFPHGIDGDSAYCGNAGCSLPWTRRDGAVNFCLSVEIDDSKAQSDLLITGINMGKCNF